MKSSDLRVENTNQLHLPPQMTPSFVGKRRPKTNWWKLTFLASIGWALVSFVPGVIFTPFGDHRNRPKGVNPGLLVSFFHEGVVPEPKPDIPMPEIVKFAWRLCKALTVARPTLSIILGSTQKVNGVVYIIPRATWRAAKGVSSAMKDLIMWRPGEDRSIRFWLQAVTRMRGNALLHSQKRSLHRKVLATFFD